ncbi:MAG: transglutaminase domain-containing protein [Candidatus Lindowbacteria bacterium]|nr:transglutaminase domain-containing protein [Candidatus Lindowbacteria bacterium]
MKPKQSITCFLCLLCMFVSACGLYDSSNKAKPAAPRYVYPIVHSAPWPFEVELSSHPDLAALSNEEKLAGLLKGSSSELETLLRLRKWTREQWDTVDRNGAEEPPWNARTTLESIRNGELAGGLCSEYSVVFLQASQSQGFQPRIVSLESSTGSGHRVVEVWSKSFNKWIMMDPLFDLHYEKDGVPLGVLELHDALLNSKNDGNGESVDLKRGPKSDKLMTKEQHLGFFNHVTLFWRNNYLSENDRLRNFRTIGLIDTATDGRPKFSHVRTKNRRVFTYLPDNSPGQ